MKIMFTFPGQGPQQVGMLHQLPDTDRTRELLAVAEQTLEEDIMQLDNEESLKTTRAVQLCLLISAVVHSELLKEQGVTPDMVAGLSIGAFPAAVVCGALEFTDALKLVSLRGDLMQQAYPSGYGLTAITGLFLEQVEAIVEQLRGQDQIIYLANVNAEQQMVVAGTEAAMYSAIELAAAKGGSGKRLAVSVPSHCDLLAKPAEQLVEAIAKVELKRPKCAYMSANRARVMWQGDAIADDLAMNMARQVRWNEAALGAYQRDVRLAIEMPPGAVLTRLCSPVLEEGEALAMSQTDIETIKVLAERTRLAR